MNAPALDRFIAGASVVSLMVLAGCAGIEYTTMALETDSRQYAAPLDMRANRVTVTVFWRDDLTGYCQPGANACAQVTDAECFIYTPAPKSWNSAPLLKRLGHEFAHCLGGRHE